MLLEAVVAGKAGASSEVRDLLEKGALVNTADAVRTKHFSRHLMLLLHSCTSPSEHGGGGLGRRLRHEGPCLGAACAHQSRFFFVMLVRAVPIPQAS